jgi:dTDP-glucose pyrophosphorylase
MNQYAKENILNVGQLSRGTVWIDTGNARDLSLATEYVRVLQQRQGRYIACLEEIALRAGWIKESKRGELEITDLMNQYAKENLLNVGQLARGTVWIDTGNAKDLSLATEYIRVLQQRQGRYIACLEEIALRAGWIEETTVRNFKIGIKSEYASYVRSLRKQNVDAEIDIQ